MHGDGFRAAPVEVVCSVADYFFFLVFGRKVCVFYCFLQICVCRHQCMRFSIGRRDLELQRLLFLVPLHKLLAAIHLVLVFTFTASATIYECLLVFIYLFFVYYFMYASCIRLYMHGRCVSFSTNYSTGLHPSSPSAVVLTTTLLRSTIHFRLSVPFESSSI